MMMAVCTAELDMATARGNWRAVTTLGSSACSVGVSKARVAPIRATKTKMCSRVIQPLRLATAIETAISASSVWHERTITRRSKRSATWPDISSRTTEGRNCTSPTMPSMKGSRVRS